MRILKEISRRFDPFSSRPPELKYEPTHVFGDLAADEAL
jgi:hypothetical protein